MEWKSKIKLKDLLEDYDIDKDELQEIERIKPNWIKRFDSIECLKGFMPKLKRVKTQTQFNRMLNDIYDYCDANRIWIN